MKCEKFFESFMSLEDYSSLPLRLKIHLRSCPDCRKEASLFRDSMLELQSSNSFDLEISMGAVIMSEVDSLPSSQPGGKLTILKWVSVGLIIFVSTFLVTYSKSYLWLEQIYGAKLIVPMSLVLGFVLSIYFIFVMGANYREFARGVSNLRFFKKLNLK